MAEVAKQSEVCAVAVRSGVRWGSFEDLPGRLADAGYEIVVADPQGRRLYLKTACAPP